MPVYQNNIIKQLLSLQLVLFISLVSYSQVPHFVNYSEEEGLPSATIYDMLQDSSSYIWFATDYGIARYDGSEFQKFSTENGLPDNSTIRLYQDLKGRIWILSYNGMLSYYQNGEIIVIPQNKAISAFNISSVIDRIYVDSLENVWLAPQSSGEILFNLNDSLASYQNRRNHAKDFYYLFFEDLGDDYKIALLDFEDDRDFIMEGNKYYIKINGHFAYAHRNYAKIRDGEYVVSCYRTVYHIRDGAIINEKKYENRIVDIYYDRSGYLWLSEFFKGVVRFEKADLDLEVNTVPSDLTISKILQDKEGAYWFSTTTDGAFYVPDFEVLVYALPDGKTNYKVTDIESWRDQVFFSTYDQHLYYIDLNTSSVVESKIYGEKIENNLYDIMIQDEGIIWITVTDDFRYSLTSKKVLPFHKKYGHKYYETKDGRIIVASKVVTIYKDDEVVFESEEEFYERINVIHEDKEGKIWFGTLHGLYYLRNNKLTKFERIPELNDSRITDIDCVNDFLVVGTNISGMYFISRDSSYNLRKDDGLASNLVKCLMVENDSTVWVGTNKGLTKYIVNFETGIDYSFERYTIGNGLPNSDINVIRKHKDLLWIGTDQGIISIDPSQTSKNSVPPKIIVESIIINNQEIDFGESLVLEHDENNILINFKGISFGGPENLSYRYYMLGHDQDLIYTQNDFAIFSNLPSGEYVFNVNVGNASQVFNEKPFSIPITVKKPFTRTPAFIISVIILGSLLVVVGMYTFISYARYREQLKQSMVILQQKLLRSQMNPHFVFNSLLAIQSFMYKNEPHEAGRYLSSFAKLIRLILKSSRKEYVPLDSEIEYLKYYLELQKLRFKDHFDYTITVGEGVLPDSTAVPPMLAQPFIENAIEHGLKDSETKGQVNISFTRDSNILLVKVEDNGIGISQALESNGEGQSPHESYGTLITRERLDMMNRKLGKKFSLNISDIRNDSGQIIGTRVSFSIAIMEITPDFSDDDQ